MERFRTFVAAYGAAFSLLLLAGCGRVSTDTMSAAGSGGDTRLPEYTLRGVTHSLYDKGALRLRVTFEKGEYFADRSELAVEKCEYVYYDGEGNILSRGTSKRATLRKDGPVLVAEDDVVIVSEANGGVLTTDRLEWLGRSNRFATDDFVTLRRPNGDMVSGKGMVADLALRVVTIKRNVKGHFKDGQNPAF